MGAGGTQHCVHFCNSFLPQRVSVEAQGPSDAGAMVVIFLNDRKKGTQNCLVTSP